MTLRRNVVPLMEYWEDVITEDNRKGVLSARTGNGTR